MDIRETRKCFLRDVYNDYISFSEWRRGNFEQNNFSPRCPYFVEQVYSPVHKAKISVLRPLGFSKEVQVEPCEKFIDGEIK